jgi:hypothetical protein
MNEELKEKGYIIIPDFYNPEEILSMRKIILFNMKVRKNMMSMGFNSGSKPDFLRDTDYKNLIPLLRLNDIHILMKSIFNAPFHLCSHNDIGLNRIVNWHKDTLNNQYKIFQKHDIWSVVNNENHEIYKFLIYLQDHTNDNNGLQLVEKSHLNPYIDTKNKIHIKNKIGSVIIFDQRITHRGQSSSQTINGFDRILLSIGFGKNNIFTEEFERGTIKRQYDQNRMIKKL